MIADGPPRRLLELVTEGDVDLVLPEIVLRELRAVLEGKIGLKAGNVDRIERLLRDLEPQIVADQADPPALSGDRNDDQVIAGALAGGAQVLVSGDRRHILPLGSHEGMRILTPQAALAEALTP